VCPLAVSSWFVKIFSGILVKITFIAWTRFQSRSEHLAQHLRSSLHFICHGRHGRLAAAPLRYVSQAWRTWRVLRQEEPAVVFIQNPPIFCVLICSIYSFLHHARYVIDSHTGAFLSRNWAWSRPLHRVLSRSALTTIVHNEAQAEIVDRWRCGHLILHDYPGSNPTGEECSLDGHFNVAVVGSFAEDEPLEAVFDAARGLSQVDFYVTGDSRQIAPGLLAKKPENARLTGYLPYPQYLGLLGAADFVLALTTRNDTLLSGASEAVSVGTPLIVSDWPILRSRFALGTVHVPNTKEGILEGVRQARKEQGSLGRGILILRDQLHSEWKQEFSELQKLLSQV